MTGTAIITADKRADTVTVTITATGLEPDMLHPQHIHGFASNQNSVCPSVSAAGADGLLTLEEGLPAYGPVQLSLTPFPTTPNGTVVFQETYPLTKDIQPLQNTSIVLHGMTVNGTYWATLPVACGSLRTQPPGQR